MIMSSPAGVQRLGKHELLEKLGHDGLTEVWKALDTEVNRYVAITLLHASLQTDPEFINRFSREARLAASLHHPNIVSIHDFQITHSPEINAPPIAYLVTDYLECETLADSIRTTPRADKLPAPTDIVDLFASISKAIDHAHRAGVIHGDIKPSHILLKKRRTAPHSVGLPALTNFGLAKIVGTGAGITSGNWLGTPLYVSPERAQGHPATERSDVYSLGIILYEICTGVCPFQGDNVTAILMQHVISAPKHPSLVNPAVPPALSAVILRAIAKDPTERFSSASALTAAIAEALHVPLPAGLFLSSHLSNTMTGPTHFHPTYPVGTVARSVGTVACPVGTVACPVGTVACPSPSPDVTPQKTQQSKARVSAVNIPATPPSSLVGQSRKAWRWKLLAVLVVLFALSSSSLVSLHTFDAGQASSSMGTLTFTDSGQYDPNTTVGYNDIISLSLHHLTTPRAGQAYFVWLLSDRTDDQTVPLSLGHLSVNAGNASLRYVSPTHTNLLARYSGIRIMEQPASPAPSLPSQDPKTWRWEGSLPYTPTPGDPNQYSFLSHLRHLLAEDPMLQENNLSGGLVIWMTRNIARVQQASGVAQSSWGPQISDKDADLIHRNIISILDYLDGQTYVWQDLPAGSPWLIDPNAGKFGLLSYTQDQEPPGYLQHIDIHLKGLTASPGHTDEQTQVAIQVDGVIAKMINDLTQVRKDAIQLAKLNNAQLRQPDTLTLLNDMATLTNEANSGWFDTTTHENVGGAIWLNMRIQQLATISLETSSQQ